MNIKKATEYSGYASTLDRAIEILLKEQMNNNNVYIDFNGCKLYSANITVDRAYQEITGCTKQQHKNQQAIIFKQYHEEEKINKQAPKNKIDSFIKEGEALIYPERKQEWEKCVRAHMEHNCTLELENALQIMKALDKNMPVEKATELISCEHSGSSFHTTLKIVGTFSKKGLDFYRANMMGNFTADTYKFVKKVDAENGIYLSNKLDKDLIRGR